MDTCPTEGNIPTEFCTCDPTTAHLVEEYLPELLKQYEFEPRDFTPEQLQEIRKLLLSGELTKARGILSDWAYECNAGKVPNGEQDCQLCGERIENIFEAKVVLPFGDVCPECVADIEKVRAENIARELIALYPDQSPVSVIESARGDGELAKASVTDVKEVWRILQTIKDLTA